MTFVASFSLEKLVAEWEPSDRPHCSDCRHCVVFGAPDNPIARCAAGHGSGSKSIWAMCRKSRPFGFRQAAECPGWESMADDQDL